MKKIVPRLMIISSQILIGALFLVFTINGKETNSVKVNSKDFNRLSEIVYKEDKLVVSDSKEDKEEEVVVETTEEVEKEIKQEVKTEVKKEIKQEVTPVIPKQEQKEQEEKSFDDYEVINTYFGTLTGYGPDCYGCGNFVTNKVSTASGYHIANIVDGVVQPAFTTTYNDEVFGEVSIVAGDVSIPFYSIVRFTIPNQEPVIAIVLDRGGTVGFSEKSLTTFDLLFATEKQAMGKTGNVKFEILRMGK